MSKHKNNNVSVTSIFFQDDCSGKGGRLAEPKTFSVLEFLRNKCRLETVNEGTVWFKLPSNDVFARDS